MLSKIRPSKKIKLFFKNRPPLTKNKNLYSTFNLIVFNKPEEFSCWVSEQCKPK